MHRLHTIMAETNEPTQFKMKQPTDVRVDMIRMVSSNGEEVDLLAMVESIDIYEDIFSNTMSGSIVVIDGMNLSSSIPIIGQETVEIQFRSPVHTKPFRHKFRVYRVSDKTTDNKDSVQYYTVYFTSLETISNRKKKVSLAFKDLTHSEMIERLFDEVTSKDSKGIKNLTPTSDLDTVIIPNWNPFKAINWICSRSFNNAACDLVFFETVDGFRLESLSQLSQNPPKYSYNRSARNRASNANNPQRDILSAYFSTEELTVKEHHNRLDGMMNGIYASNLAVYDSFRKELSYEVYRYADNYDEVPHLGYRSLPYQNDLFSDGFESYVQYHPFQSNAHENQSDPRSTVLRRNARIKEFDSYSVFATIAGNPDIRPGDTLDLVIPAPKAARNQKKALQDYQSGRYMVRVVRHNIYRNQEYRCMLTLMRDGLGAQLPDEKDGTIDSQDGSNTVIEPRG